MRERTEEMHRVLVCPYTHVYVYICICMYYILSCAHDWTLTHTKDLCAILIMCMYALTRHAMHKSCTPRTFVRYSSISFFNLSSFLRAASCTILTYVFMFIYVYVYVCMYVCMSFFDLCMGAMHVYAIIEQMRIHVVCGSYIPRFMVFLLKSLLACLCMHLAYTRMCMLFVAHT